MKFSINKKNLHDIWRKYDIHKGIYVLYNVTNRPTEIVSPHFIHNNRFGKCVGLRLMPAKERVSEGERKRGRERWEEIAILKIHFNII